MTEFMEMLTQYEDMMNVFTIQDVVVTILLSFVLSLAIAWIYKITHQGTSYTQSFVHTLVLVSMIVAIIMLIVGSNIARAFTLVGALSIIRFRNAVKETRDVGFIFFTMAIGMAIGTRFYLLGLVAALVISLVTVLMTRLDWFAREMSSQILTIHVPNETPFDGVFDSAFLKYTTVAELISVGSVQNGTLTELVFSIGMKKSNQVQAFLAEIRKINSGNKVNLIAGYNGTDL